MSSNIDPDDLVLSDFDLSYLDDDAVVDQEAPQIGVGLGFDFETGDFIFAPKGGVTLVEDGESLSQWIAACLMTPVGENPIYSARFGSRVREIVAAGGSLDISLPLAIEEALLRHERIAEVRDIRLAFPEDGRVEVSMVVVTDVGGDVPVEVALA